MILNEKDFNEHKEYILRELAKLERLNWSADSKVASSIFPYVLVEAMSLLLNARMDGVYKDFAKNSEGMEDMIKSILGEI